MVDGDFLADVAMRAFLICGAVGITAGVVAIVVQLWQRQPLLAVAVATVLGVSVAAAYWHTKREWDGMA